MKRDFIRNRRLTKESYPTLEIKIEKRSASDINGILQAIINIIVYALIYSLFIKNNRQYMTMFIAFMAASVIAQLLLRFGKAVSFSKSFPFLRITTGKKLYKKYLEREYNNTLDYIKKYSEWVADNYHSAKDTLLYIDTLDAHLFSRLPFQSDFLSFRLGLSNSPYPIKISYPNESYKEYDMILDEYKAKFDSLINNESHNEIPYPFSLQSHKRLAISGRNIDAYSLVQIINTFVIEIAAYHSPEELGLCFIFDNYPELEWTRFLPHVWLENYRLLFQESEENVFFNAIDHIINEYRNKHFVAFIDADFAKSFVKLYSMFNADSLPDNISVVFFSKSGLIPSRVNYYIECDYDQARNINGLFNNTSWLKLELTDSQECSDAAKMLFNTEIIDTQITERKSIPNSITLFDLFKIKRAAQLPKATLEERTNIQFDFPVKVGVGSQGEDISINLTNDGDGNHCLVTGTNGSGKSEFILSYVVTACAMYPPEYLSFVVIDFKNGAMSSFINSLPHCLGEFTNDRDSVSKRELSRIACLLESEIDHRFKVLKNSNCEGNLSKYHELYAEGKVIEPLPRLLIIVDEVAVFFSIDDQASKYITHIATVGRQAGLILMLATQSKSGVIPSQVRTNINVQVDFYSEDDRQNTIKIKGRAIINSLKKNNCLCQMGYASVHYGNDLVVDFITWSGASRIISNYSPQTQLDKVINDICSNRWINSAEIDEILTQTLERVQDVSSFDIQSVMENYYDLYSSDSTKLIFPIGVADNIYERKLSPVVYDAMDANLIIWGKPQSGKTALIKVIVYAICNKKYGATPNEVNLYIVAKDGSEYSALSFPHIGNILDANNLYYFLLFLINEIKRRRENKNASYIPIIGIIDDCFDYIQASEEIAKMLDYITREANRFKIYLIMSVSIKPSFGISSSLLKNFEKRMVLNMGASFDYSSIIMLNNIKDIPDIKGRCLINRMSREQINLTFEAQIASLYNDEDIMSEAMRYSELWVGRRSPRSISLMPRLLSCMPNTTDFSIPIGLARNLETFSWKLNSSNTFLVSYFTEEIVFQFLEYITGSLLSMNFKVILIDSQRSYLRSVESCENLIYFNCNQQNELKDYLLLYDANKTENTAIIICEYYRFLFPSLREEHELLKAVDALIQNRNVWSVFAEFKDYINASRTSATYLTQRLEGGSGLLLGKTPSEHTFGYNPLSLAEQSAPIPAGWGVGVENGSKDARLLKIATRFGGCE